MTFNFWFTIITALQIGAINGSYLDRPRLHFSGNFQADPSTRNNRKANYKIGIQDFNNVWNPLGTGDFRLYNTTVTSVTYLNGTNTKSDPIVGLPMLNSDTFTSGKLADLDVDVRHKSEIWGQYISLNWAHPAIERQRNSFIGKLQTIVLVNDAWPRLLNCTISKGEMHTFSASGKSIVTDIQWAEDQAIDSNFLKELKSISKLDALSIRMVVFFIVNYTSPMNFTFGEIRGTIGPAFPNEPTQFTGQRMLHVNNELIQPPSSIFPNVPQCIGDGVTWLYNAPFKVGPRNQQASNKRVLIVDFGNAVSMDQYQNLLDLGELILGIYNKTKGCVEYLGDLNYRQPNWLEESAGIQEFPLTPEQYDTLQENPVVVLHLLSDNDLFSLGPKLRATTVSMATFKQKGLVVPYCTSGLQKVPYGLLMLEEATTYVRPWRQFVFRANPGEIHPFYLFVTHFGKPKPNATVHLFPVVEFGVRDPIDGVTYENYTKTNQSGIATFHLHAHNVGQPRHNYDIPGQAYKYAYNVSPSEAPQNPDTNYCSIKVYSNVSYPNAEGITWVDHVSPIFEQYAQLYPVMKPIVNMANYTDVKLKKGPLIYSLSLPPSHPSYMPVTRDLSDAKREMILKWLNNGCRYNSTNMDGPPPAPPQCKPFFNVEFDHEVKATLPESCRAGHLGNQHPRIETYKGFAKLMDRKNQVKKDNDVNSNEYDCMNIDWQRMAKVHARQQPTLQHLHCLLQTAIRLEFSTLPPYLTALYSIIDGCNVEVQRVILSICMQEMLHMAQAANLLIALGGHPIINSPNFTLTYPGHLPGGVLPGLTVHLRKATIYQILYNFMPIEFPTETAVDLDPPQFHNNTVGDFYVFINKTLDRLYAQKGEAIFCQECFKNEVSWPKYNSSFPGTLHNVTNITSAHKAIQEIVEQGEGAGPIDPTTGLGDQLAHYYKFEEIVCGNKLKENSTGGYQFNGEPIEFDESGVYPMADDPSTKKFDSTNLGSNINASHYSRVFNEGYRHLLNRMHEGFNGEPEVFEDAVTIMQSLKIHAIKLMHTFFDGTHTAGPTWEYDV